MVKMSQNSVHVQLDVEQLKLLLTTLYAFDYLIKQANLQALLSEAVESAEKFYDFKFDYLGALQDINKFSDKSIGFTSDIIFDSYYDLINADFSLFGENHV